MHSMHLHICTGASNHVSCDIGCLGCPRNAEMRWEMISMALHAQRAVTDLFLGYLPLVNLISEAAFGL